MIPFIDLLMVTISFLLITAVWSHMARINADALVPGPPREVEPENVPEEKVLHVYMTSPDNFELAWKMQGAPPASTSKVPRQDVVIEKDGRKSVRYPELARRIAEEWRSLGSYRAGSDPKFDQAVLHTDNSTAYVYMIGVIDAIYHARRDFTVGGKSEKVPAFNVTFAVN